MGAMEEHGLVLDYLPLGKSTDMQREPLVQLIGETHFTLLEAVPKKDANLKTGDKVFIGKGEREKVDHIEGRVEYFDLTSSAKNELKEVVKQIVNSREAFFVSFFNKCGPVTIRLHQLELFPGIGKKHMHEIIAQREKKQFESFSDIRARVALMPDPANVLADRIEEEIKGDSKYYILTRPPAQHNEDRFDRRY